MRIDTLMPVGIVYFTQGVAVRCVMAMRLFKALAHSSIGEVAAFYAQAAGRAVKEWAQFLRKHFAKEVCLAVLVFIVAWATAENKLVDSLGESLKVLLLAVLIFGGLSLLWYLIRAPVKLYQDARTALTDQEKQFISTLGHLKQIQTQYASNITPLPPDIGARRAEANAITTELESHEVLLKRALDTGEYWNAAARPFVASAFNGAGELDRDAAFVPIRQKLSRLYNDLNGLTYDVKITYGRNLNRDKEERQRVEGEAADRFQKLMVRVQEAHADVTTYIAGLEDSP